MSDFTLRISVLKEFVEAIGAAGDSIKHLTDGFAHLISSGFAGYDQAKARIVYAKLVDISALSTSLAVSQPPLAAGLEEYAEWAPTLHEESRQWSWEQLVRNMRDILDNRHYQGL